MSHVSIIVAINVVRVLCSPVACRMVHEASCARRITQFESVRSQVPRGVGRGEAQHAAGAARRAAVLRWLRGHHALLLGRARQAQVGARSLLCVFV